MKICFIGNISISFQKNDYKILNKHFKVELIQPPKKKIEWLKYPFIVAKKIIKCDIVFCWFAGWHSLFPVLISKLFRKKSIVIVGGYDAAYVPEINYGAFTNLKERLPAKYVLKNVDKTLVVDPSLTNDIIKNAGINGENIDYLPTGYDPNYWEPKGKKENLVLTVGSINHSVVKRKGFVTFIKAAKYVPSATFVLIGKFVDDSIDYLKKIAPSNVKFTGFVSDKELLEWYQRAKVYCQLSRYEGLPNALCEGMLCGDIPIGTKYCGIPRAIDDTGFYVAYCDEKATAEAIKKALHTLDELGKKARERIRDNFPIEKREKELVKIINDLCEKR